MKLQECEVCNPPKIFTELDFKQYTYWETRLHLNQCYLGRSVILLKRHLEDFFDINETELQELYTITKHLRNVLKKEFNPTMFNYATLGNITRHVHLHLIPRYETAPVFEGITFEDYQWGQNYSPYNTKFSLPKPTLFKIRDTIKKNI